MKKEHAFLAAAIGLLALSQTAGAAVLFTDNFDRSDTDNIDAAGSQNSSQGGTLANSIEIRSSKQTLDIISGQLALPSHSRARFHDEANPAERYDFAPALAMVGSSGIITVSWLWDATLADSSDWTGFSFGTDNNTSGEPDVRVNDTTTDLGVLVKLNGDVQYFDNGVATTLTGVHSASGLIPITLSVEYASLENGGNLTLLSILVDGVETLDSEVSTFSWNFDDGSEIHFELEGRYGNPNLIDNLSISADAVPEPSVICLCGLGILSLLRRQR
ncbi:hypothetical protein JIN85_08870 [Luteolibacter pohnpeiensis]|uniref:PEP-CTERM protein-sorting domain-containing protein n=1 Tax=Luteolibacter pohnpeiensis TaxID=454153 RepID=A0A934S819_9BACT|nr:hypothetical protein [Luteolibacter pohnpeiensis]MBK1882526.1 hypothetical protein [Luteolibacter pohnpeiensis]